MRAAFTSSSIIKGLESNQRVPSVVLGPAQLWHG
jgi:hypothetical protein